MVFQKRGGLYGGNSKLKVETSPFKTVFDKAQDVKNMKTIPKTAIPITDNKAATLEIVGYAKKKGRKIDASKHLVLSTGHPSPLSANRGYWFGNKHFSKTNEYLVGIGRAQIAW